MMEGSYDFQRFRFLFFWSGSIAIYPDVILAIDLLIGIVIVVTIIIVVVDIVDIVGIVGIDLLRGCGKGQRTSKHEGVHWVGLKSPI